MTRVAVVTRTQNRPLMLPRARKSVTNQTYSDFIWVLVNDAGAHDYVDESADQARSAGTNVQVVHRDKSVGMEAASNAGVRAVDTEFVIIHDDDDGWHPDFLRKMVEYLDENSEYVGAICHSMAVYEQVSADSVTEVGRSPYNEHIDSIQLADQLQQNNYAPISFLYRRSVYDAVSGYDESLPVLGDWDFNLRVLLKGDIGLLPELLANYHIREEVDKDLIEYGNSITAGENVHMLQDAKYRNLKLREDIENGRPGLGFLLALGWQSLRLNRNTDFIARIFRYPQRKWRGLKKRFR